MIAARLALIAALFVPASFGGPWVPEGAAQQPPGGAPPTPLPAAPAPADAPQAPAWLAPVWSIVLPSEPTSAPAFDASQGYVLLRNNTLVAVALDSGALRWSVTLAAPVGPSAGEGLVFTAPPGSIEARARENGDLRWRLATEGNVAAPMSVRGGWLLAAADSGTAMAIRARDGATVWQRVLGAPARVAPELGGDGAYFPLADGRLVAVNLHDGSTRWERKLGGAPAEILVLDDRLFVGSADNFLYCLNVENGRIRWRWRTGGDIVGRPAVDARAVYFVSLDNVLRALNRGNGHQIWKGALATRPSGGPLPLGDALLLVSGLAPQVWAFRKADGVLAAEVPAPAELAAPPHVLPPDHPTHIRMILLTGEGHLLGLALAPIGHPVRGLPLFVDLPSAVGTPPPATG